MRRHITTLADLRNWVDTVTSGWEVRTDDDVDHITNAIRHDPDAPQWGTDWTVYLESLPELWRLLPAERQ